jgi:ABC-type transporter Mla subunit MlaD
MKLYLFIITLLLLFSCNSKNKKLIIHFENHEGINIGSDVICRNKPIGRVTNLRTEKEEGVNVSISLVIDGLPKDSKFTIQEKDLLHNAIYVTPGKSDQYLSKSDKIAGEIATITYIKRRKL